MTPSVVADTPTPPRMSFDVDPVLKDAEKGAEQTEQQKQRKWSRWKWVKREDKDKNRGVSPKPQDTPPQTPQTPQTPPRPGFGSRLTRRVGVGIPRSQTFKRQEDEQRKNLEPHPSFAKERREVSRVRQRAMSAQPVMPKVVRRQGSAPEVGGTHEMPSILARIEDDHGERPDPAEGTWTPPISNFREASPRPTETDEAQTAEDSRTELSFNDALDEELRMELEHTWILNLSMHFRDKSPREKFFVTYAETPQRWRRVTISIDYRNAPEESLEADLQKLSSQRDKNARVYESIRMSLPEIQFYDTVTNLKLETRDERLHVHVTEDVNEIISYPSTRLIQHLPVKSYRESELHFVEHMSGFVYKVKVGKHTWIKKEIPGPDSVEEFLYEINALSELVGSKNVIELKGLVVDEDHHHVKGLLIAYADQGALIDILYDHRDGLPWTTIERWSRQIIRGLMEIHECGFVQGDFTLSNIVVDGRNRAKIIDINRRGCPVGWEPPEIGRLIESHQRIGMFIGVKSDLFQLGMVLWALVMQEDEPERQSRPLLSHALPDETPEYLRTVIERCLSSHPGKRLSCKDLLGLFPKNQQAESPTANFEIGQQFQETTPQAENAHPSHPTEDGNDIAYFPHYDREATGTYPSDLDENSLAFTDSMRTPTGPELDHLQAGSRGRSPPRGNGDLESLHLSPVQSNSAGLEPTIISVSPGSDPRWAAMTSAGSPYFVPDGVLDTFGHPGSITSPVDQTETTGVEQAPHQSIHRISTGFIGNFEHVDSGLADMDFEDTRGNPVKPASENVTESHFTNGA